MTSQHAARLALPVAPPDGAVVVLQWPEEAEQVDALGAMGVGRLLLVAPGAEAPEDRDRLTDWIRLPAERRDITARIGALERRLADPDEPSLDGFGVLRRRDLWVSLPPIEERLADQLLVRAGKVVRRGVLARAAWPLGAPNDRAIDPRIMLLRRRIAPLGLRIRTVRSQGFMLENGPVP